MAVGTLGSTFSAELNRLANGGTYPAILAYKGDQEAANVWAGTTGQSIQGALNRKAGKTDPTTFLDLNGICNLLGSTSNLEAPEALRRISS
jgi:hypothetical protein